MIHIDSLDVLDDLKNDQIAELFLAIKSFQNGEEINLSPVVKIAFVSFKNQFNRDNEKYEKTCEARRIAGSLGGKQKVANTSKCKQKLANVADSDSKKDSDSKNKKDSISLSKKTSTLPKSYKEFTKEQKENHFHRFLQLFLLETIEEKNGFRPKWGAVEGKLLKECADCFGWKKLGIALHHALNTTTDEIIVKSEYSIPTILSNHCINKMVSESSKLKK